MTRRIAWIAFALALICGIPGWGPLNLTMGLIFFVERREEVPDLSVPDTFRGGVYEVQHRALIMHDSVHVYYRAANGDRREVLYIADTNDVHPDRIQLSPSSDRLAVMDRGHPSWRLFISSQELGSLGGPDGPLVIVDGKREGRERVWRAGFFPWWVGLLDSALFLALWLLLLGRCRADG